MGLLLVEGNSKFTNKIYEVSIFTLNYLFEDKKDLDQIEITITLVGNLYKNNNICGDVLNMEDNQYHIRLDKDHPELFYTLIHELVHCWQYYYSIVDDTLTRYNDRLYEQQAYYLENVIYEKLCETQSLTL